MSPLLLIKQHFNKAHTHFQVFPAELCSGTPQAGLILKTKTNLPVLVSGVQKRKNRRA